MTESKPEARLTLLALGDLLLPALPDGLTSAFDTAAALAPMKPSFDEADIVFANLECTLRGDGAHVETEPRVAATPEMVRPLADLGVDIVTLANNHAFDFRESGFRQLSDLLEALGIMHFGAGSNLQEAAAPAVVERHGLRVGFLAAVDRSSGPPCFAADSSFGVAPMDIDMLAGRVRGLRPTVDHVVVSLHWGRERFDIPSPEQMAQARRLVDAGASAVLGHHPHVVQGMEWIADRPIVYSLGNFTSRNVWYTDGDAIVWNRTERIGCMLRLVLDKSRVIGADRIPVYDDGQAVRVDRSALCTRRLRYVDRLLAKGVTSKRYRRECFRVDTLRPILNHLRPSELKRFPKKLRKLLRKLTRQSYS